MKLNHSSVNELQQKLTFSPPLYCVTVYKRIHRRQRSVKLNLEDKLKDSTGWGPYICREFIYLFKDLHPAFRALSRRHRSTQSEINTCSISEFQTVADVIYMYKNVYLHPCCLSFFCSPTSLQLPFFLSLSLTQKKTMKNIFVSEALEWLWQGTGLLSSPSSAL